MTLLHLSAFSAAHITTLQLCYIHLRYNVLCIYVMFTVGPGVVSSQSTFIHEHLGLSGINSITFSGRTV